MVLAVLALSSCKEKEKSELEVTTAESYVVEQDACYMFQDDSNRSPITKAEDGYYFLFNNIVYHADEKLNLTALCNKPNCLHAREMLLEDRKNCNGYMGDMTNAQIYCYDNRIYVLTRENIFKDESFIEEGIFCNAFISMDENGRDKELFGDYLPKLRQTLFHRGYIYYADYHQVKESEEKIITYVSWQKMNVQTGEKEEIMAWDGATISEIQDIYAYRNYVYCRTLSNIYVYSIFENSIVNELKMNISELPVKVTSQGNDNVEVRPVMSFMDDKLLLRYKTDNNEVFISDLEGNNISYAFSLQDSWNNVGADDKYIYEDNRLADGVVIGEADRILYYYDKETYECLGEINLGFTNYRRLGYGDENYFFFLKEYDKETWCLMYFDKDDIGTENFEIKELFKVLKTDF